VLRPHCLSALATRVRAVKQDALSHRRTTLMDSGSVTGGDEEVRKALLRPGVWAREELNLRPLPCQIQRAAPGMNVGWLETGKDH
jgi:hypothetical protein